MAATLKLWIRLLQFTFLMLPTEKVLIWFPPRQCKKKSRFSETHFFFRFCFPLYRNSIKEQMFLAPDVSQVCTYDYITRC